jgi:hypothetical protein
MEVENCDVVKYWNSANLGKEAVSRKEGALQNWMRERAAAGAHCVRACVASVRVGGVRVQYPASLANLGQQHMSLHDEASAVVSRAADSVDQGHLMLGVVVEDIKRDNLKGKGAAAGAHCVRTCVASEIVGSVSMQSFGKKLSSASSANLSQQHMSLHDEAPAVASRAAGEARDSDLDGEGGTKPRMLLLLFEVVTYSENFAHARVDSGGKSLG